MIIMRCLRALAFAMCVAMSVAMSVAIPVSADALARGGGMRSEDRYNPQHVDSLPAEIRQQVVRGCAAPKALHAFASYLDDPKRIVLHFEHAWCGDRSGYCTASGCLHEVYVFTGGRYRLVRRYYAPPGD
jgi:hypothetical protein